MLAAQSEAEAASTLDAISAFTLDTLVLMLDGLQQRREGFLLPLSSVLGVKGCSRSGAERDALIAQVAAEVRLVSRLAIQTPKGPLPFFSIEWTKFNNLGRAWGDAALIEPGPALKGQLRNSAYVSMPVSVVALDHRAVRGPDVVAKKLAVALYLKPEVRTARDLLARIGESVDRSVEPRGGRVAARFDTALERLEAATGMSIRQSPVHARQKGWLKGWLDTPLEFTIGDTSGCASSS
jgi:hypothetical protein